MAEDTPWDEAKAETADKDVPWAVKPVALTPFEKATPWETVPQTPLPMPSFFESIGQGATVGAKQALQSGQVLTGEKAPEPIEETSPAAQGYEWSDLWNPSRGLAKTGYQLAKSAPLPVAGGIAAGTAGAAVAGPVGGLAGGAGGAAIGAAYQAIGPAFAAELKKNPDDPDGAWNRAMESASISGMGTGASWALFPLKIPGVASAVKNALFQTFGVQPGVAMATKAVHNIAEGKPATEGVGETYATGVVSAAIPAAGFMALTKPAVVPATSGLKPTGGVGDWYRKTFQPELVSDKALQADPQFAKYKSASAQEADAIINRADEHYYQWNKVPEADQLEFLRQYETGQPLTAANSPLVQQHPWMEERAQVYRDLLKQAHQDEANYGSKAGFIDEYFPHLWEDPVKARTTFENLSLPQSLGPSWFQKARYYDLIDAGMQSGLKLKTTNPEQLVTMRLLSGADMRQRMELLNNLQAMGVAVPTKNAPPSIAQPSWRNPEPWQPINAPNKEPWMIAPDVQPLWENAVNAKGLWADPGVMGSTFRGWMALKNAWVPLKLALSAFHPLHVAHINLSNNITRALGETFGSGQQSLGRRIAALPEAAVQSVFDMALALPIGTPMRGKTGREAWLTPRKDQTAEQRGVTDLFNEGGFSPQLSEQLRISAKRGLSDAIRNNQYLRAIPYAGRRAIEVLQKPIFEQWIPNLKAAAFQREAESLFRRQPDLLNDPLNRSVALRAIGKQVDNRFGEMFYGGLFWNRMVKDSAIGSFLSLGWNLGFAREFVGGALEPAARRLAASPTPTRQLIRDVTSKSTNAFVYSMTAMGINGMMNYAMTGEMPEGYDYIFPRVGGNNPDGSPRRITNMFYTREVPMAKKNIEERQSMVGGLSQMLYHKLMFAPFVEMATNRDYFGYQMYDENAPFFKQAYQFGKAVMGEQMNPMAITGAKRALELSGKPHGTLDVLKSVADPDVYMSLLGFPPAPAYASKTAIQNRIGHAYQQFVAPTEKPFEQKEQLTKRKEARDKYLIAKQKGDEAMMAEAAKEAVATGMKLPNLKKIKPGDQDVYMFSRLPDKAQAAILRDATQDEFKRYYPKAKRDAKRDADVSSLHGQYYQ